MSIELNPYISFNKNAREAGEFYHSVFGGDLTVGTFGDFGASTDPSEDNLVMHSQLVAPGGLTLMMSDTPDRMHYDHGTDISVSLSGTDADRAELTGYWDKLIVGANVTQPLATAQWGDAFGMCVDKFGIGWMVNISAPSA